MLGGDEMFKRTRLAQAVGAVTAAGSLGGGVALPASAQESEDAAEIESMIVTGSRIRRQVADTPNPITVFDRAEIELTGLENVADLLRNTTYNAFGSFRERSGTSFGQIALVNLRGLGADRTAILVNGRRVPGNPFTGTAAVDLNSIPLAAIERIEVLTDSASAVYGTDALGGVINIILRKDFDGTTFQIGTDFPEHEGADSDHFNFVFGARGERGSIMFTAEWFTRDPIFDGDRDYSKAQVLDPGDGTLPDLGVDTIGVSGGGNTAFAPGFSAAASVGDCPTSVYAGVIENPFGVPGTACGFGYADISAQTGGLDRISTSLNVDYEWTPTANIFFENRLTRIESFGRYAPAVGFFSVPGDSPYNPFDTTADSYPKLADGTPRPFSIFHRFVGHGPRDDDTVRFEMDNVLGLNGTLADDAFEYEVYARYYRYEASAEGETYILQSQVELEVEQGDYNLTDPLSTDPTHLAALGRMAATLYRDILTDYTAAGGHVNGFAMDLPGGPIGWAAGAEVASESYMDDYDSFREAGNILGSAGNSSAGNRSRWATFAEVSLPVLEDVEVNVAGRYDSYDDFGSAFSPQIAVRYQPLDMLVLRASWGEGLQGAQPDGLVPRTFAVVQRRTRRLSLRGPRQRSVPDQPSGELHGRQSELGGGDRRVVQSRRHRRAGGGPLDLPRSLSDRLGGCCRAALSGHCPAPRTRKQLAERRGSTSRLADPGRRSRATRLHRPRIRELGDPHGHGLRFAAALRVRFGQRLGVGRVWRRRRLGQRVDRHRGEQVGGVRVHAVARRPAD